MERSHLQEEQRRLVWGVEESLQLNWSVQSGGHALETIPILSLKLCSQFEQAMKVSQLFLVLILPLSVYPRCHPILSLLYQWHPHHFQPILCLQSCVFLMSISLGFEVLSSSCSFCSLFLSPFFLLHVQWKTQLLTAEPCSIKFLANIICCLLSTSESLFWNMFQCFL